MRPLFAALAVCALLTACSRGEPQSGLSTAKIVIDTRGGPAKFNVEIAADEASREKGLMYRTTLPSDAGMLFEYPAPALVVFWMKNTPLSLDMIFITRDGRIHRIAENTEPLSERIIPSGGPVRAVLEVIGGTARKLGLAPGDRVAHPMFSAR